MSMTGPGIFLEGPKVRAVPARSPLVVLAGNIATGKSSLLAPLSRRLSLPSYAERWRENPWFAGRVRSSSALASSQIWFLVDSAAQLLRAAGKGGVLERSPDEHALVFAQTLLEPIDASLVMSCHARLAVTLPDPDLVVFLRASPEELLRRVRYRNRDQERDLTLDRLHSLNDAYEHLLGDWTKCPIVDIDTETIDVRSHTGVESVAVLLASSLGSRGAGPT
jgi:deoxyadenosine/deoxycytidine kinase